MSFVANDLSIRQRIMSNIVDRFKNVKSGVDGYTLTWAGVTDRPMTKVEIAGGDVIGIFDTAESKTAEMGFMRCHLTVLLEFFYQTKVGDSPSTELNRILLEVQRTIRSDIYCGGLSLNLLEVRNELDVVGGSADRLLSGIVEIEVLYRHNVNDPRKII